MTASTLLPRRTDESHDESWWLIWLLLIVLALWLYAMPGPQPPSWRPPDGIPWLVDDRREVCGANTSEGRPTHLDRPLINETYLAAIPRSFPIRVGDHSAGCPSTLGRGYPRCSWGV